MWVLVSGVVLAVKGALWWHTSSVGHFVNSMHLWSVELFFVFMVIHLWGKFFMAAWRGRRALTWITGAVAFLGSIGTAFTGYLSQSNFDAQWISTQAKDGLNSVGIGAVLQRPRHRPDAAVARHAAAAGGRASSWCCTSSWSAATASCRRSTRFPLSRQRRPSRQPVASTASSERPPKARPRRPTRTCSRPGRTTWSRNSSSRSSWSGCSPVPLAAVFSSPGPQGDHPCQLGAGRP